MGRNAESLEAVHTHTHTHTGNCLNNKLASSKLNLICEKINKKLE